MTTTTTPKPETDGATERPWKLFHQGALISIYRNGVDDIIHWTGFDAAHSRGKETLANAKLIIDSVNSHDTLQSENACLREQVKELREALRPFCDWHVTGEFTLQDLRRARDLMEKTNA